MRILKSKMEHVNRTQADVIATANPGCMLQLSAGARLFGRNQRVVHVVQLLDEAYGGNKSIAHQEYRNTVPEEVNPQTTL
jgi:Fe-S oxidoreductase